MSHDASKIAVERCAAASNAGELDFGVVVKTLAEAGVEAYHADYRRSETTYYWPDGSTHVVAMPHGGAAVADAFDGDEVRAAIRGAQAGIVRYPEFVRRTTAAGCMGYVVFIAGRHVQYFGRRGEVHIEHFPAAKT